ncbi:sulfotransferase [Mycobacterium koreense]|uniref:Sulfotransferase family protein n=1 Tax=Mycolicibacillus koreensis TaxID=1069220 RepID=A0A7I7SG36_9MYCO|nr:sulfotransferase [Mycolicibacillus koreensis]MCV7250454.1 sulfotransferase [Mycolicibacillus koreensis]OSC27774.1 sulfotransferase family protein [Mycolicibacillus koreensis]BBY55778.1 putative sulfotransferase [Mycolicibacillus koreensis]
MSAWAPAARSAEARRVYAAAEADRAERPQRYRLGVEALGAVVETATAGRDPAGLGDPDQWRPGLEHYLASADEDGRLNALGARMVRDTAVGRLRARAALAGYTREHPTVPERALRPPIVIVGGWRTGTTLVFRTLARDPRLRAPLPVELSAPWRMAGLRDGDREARIDASAPAHDLLHLLNPTMAVVHDSGPRMPEECVLGMGTTLRNWAFPSTVRLDGYARWLAGEDFAAEYAAHRTMLQILDDGRRWVLKAPAHTAELAHLAATYPGACLVWLHRDIVDTVASGASLFATYRATYSDHVDAADVGRFQTEQTELWLRRAVAFRSTPLARAVTIVDVAYGELLAAPAAVLRRVYDAAGLDPPDTAALLEAQRRDAPRHAHGTHRYRPQDFGIDPAALRDRMAFYTDRLPAGG